MRKGSGRLALAVVAIVGPARAQQIEPRIHEYSGRLELPDRGLRYSTGGLATDPAQKIENAQLRVQNPVVT